MSVRISDSSVVIRNRAAESAGGVKKLLDEAHPTASSADRNVTAVSFASEPERNAFAARLRANGLGSNDVIEIDLAGEPEWLEVDRGACEAWLKGLERGEAAPLEPLHRRPFEPLEHLSRSDSGLHYVRERKSGLIRTLTDDELQGFTDPPPCEECGEQFGCEHYNCARERLLGEAEVETVVPQEWRQFARDSGVSRNDLERLRSIVRVAGEYQLADHTSSDMRMQELVLLLNESR